MAKQSYDHKKIEQEAQAAWADLDLYTVDLTASDKEPYYLLTEFPYPSGDLHIGHWYAFAVTDIYARYVRMTGKHVLFPIGFDAFGLPAENAAIQRGLDPKVWTYENMEKMRTQIRSMGTSFDWSKEVVTCEPAYYKWTQWLFLKLFEHGLAEHREAPVKWCPKDCTVLANEQVVDGACERCGTAVEEKSLTQWFLKITSYADRLLTDLAPLPWREDIKEAQRSWIGKSEGARITFAIEAEGVTESVAVFTTRPDTLFGVTYIVLAPEHPLLGTLLDTASNRAEVEAYRKATSLKTERERTEHKDKTGVRLEGIVAVNPVNTERIPVYVADYVLASYGTGAVMAVPAHDERDFEFARTYDLPVRQVVAPVTGEPSTQAVRRDGGCAVVFDPKTQKYAVLTRPNTYLGLCAGGVEPDEDITQGILREVREESGLVDYAHVEIAGEAYANFHNAVKQMDVTAHATCLLVILASTTAVERQLEAHEQFEVEWISAASLREHWLTEGGRNVEHWLWFLQQAAGRAIELGYDTTSDPAVFKRQAYTGDGMLINSGEFNEQSNRDAIWDITQAAQGERTTNFRIRDWLVSRQRYWGCPIPVVYDPEGKPHAVPSEHLPWLLPTDVDFTPTGKAPLASSQELHDRVERIFGTGWTPEYDTLDTFVDSSWYYLRYLDPVDEHDFSDTTRMKQWLPVDRYSGGSEHTTMHLLYARFFHKALYDLALVPTSEPFNERFNRGLILGSDGQKMSKRWGNVVNPDEMVARYGADAVRLYLAFVGPYNEPGHYPWKLDGVEAMRRFLDRMYSLSETLSDDIPDERLQRAMAKAINKTGVDSARFKFNTAVSALMVLVKDLESRSSVPKAAYLQLVQLLAPFAPHLADHLWSVNGGEGSVHASIWPETDPTLLVETESTLIIQVNGKKRAEIAVGDDVTEQDALAQALALPPVAHVLADRHPQKVIYIPKKILNIVCK